MRNLLLFCLLARVANGAIQNVTVVGVTATQAVLHYTAPNNSACSVEVSESSTYLPLVNDVDNAKFAMASSDARAGSTVNGAERLFVVGKRAAETGLDTVRYSRALQTATPHYFRITCPSTGDQASGTFQTNTIPFGNSYAEAQPVDNGRPGSYALPALSASDRTKQVIDPQTGLLIKTLTLPQDVFAPVTGVPLTVSRGAAWRGLSNLASADGKPATVQGSTGALFLALDPASPYFNFFTPNAAAYQNPSTAFAYYQVSLIAAVNQGSGAPVNPDDAKIVACLTVDGANCYAGSSKYETQLTSSLAPAVLGTTNTIDLWQATAGAALPSWPSQAVRQGTVICDGSPSVSFASGAYFAANWGPGSNLNVNGVDYPVAAVANTVQLTLAVNCPSTITGSGAFDLGNNTFRTSTNTFASSDSGKAFYVAGAGAGGANLVTYISQVVDPRTVVLNDGPAVSGASGSFGFPAAYTGNNFGVLVWKKTASADTISLDYGSVNYALNFYFPFTLGGGYKLCAATTVTGPNGRPGYNCAMPSGSLYWIDAQSGEAHLFGNENTSPNVGCGSYSQVFDPNDPDSFYCAGTGAVYKTKYYGNHGEPVALNPGGNLKIFQNLNNCDTTRDVPPFKNQQPCILTTPLTAGTDIPTLAVAFTANPAYAPQFDPTLFRNLQFKDVDDNGNVIFHIWRGGGNSVAWLVVYSPTATSNSEGGTSQGSIGNHGCVGGGRPGCVIAAMPAWARPGCRWCTTKSGDSPYPGWADTATYPWTNSGAGSGPYYVQVVDGSANHTPNVFDGGSTLQPCPANSFGAAGNNCSMVTVSSEPVSPNHGSGETGMPGELGAAMPGDRFDLAVDGSGELMTLIAKQPGAQAGTWVYTLWRDVNHPATAHAYAASGANPALFTICGANQAPLNTQSGGAFFWNFLSDPHGMNQSGLTIPPDPASVNNHSFWLHGNGGFASAVLNDTRCNGPYYACYSTRLLKGRPFEQVVMEVPTAGVMTQAPAFGTSFYDASNHQSHPTGGGERAPADRLNFMFDGRPYRGGFSSGSVTGSGSNPASLVGGQLYKFTSGMMPNLDLPYRKVYPTAAFSGQAPLVDISSPATGNVLGTTSADAFKYCVASAANECRSGSSMGDVYVNAPNVRYPFCFQAAQNLNLSDEYDICIGGSPSIRDAIIQIDMTQVDNEGRFQRVLTKFNRPRVLSVFYSPYVLPNGQWMIFEAQFPGDGSTNKSLLLAKIPPPAPIDNYNRLDFIPISVQLPALAGAASAYVRFGYAENGGANLFCTSRAESCVVGGQTSATTVDPKNPFFFETTEAGKWSGAACTNGCTVTIPGIPQRVLYYQYVYQNGAASVYTSPVYSTVTP